MARAPAAGAAALWLHIRPFPRCSAATKGRPHQVACTNQLHWKLNLSDSESHRSKILGSCTFSASLSKIGTSRGPADVSSAHNDLSMGRLMDADTVPGAHMVIFGYWTGPDTDDGCGYVEAILQRIV